MPTSKLSYHEAIQIFRLDVETGLVYWKQQGRKRTLGKPVGHAGLNSSNGGGYRRVWYDGHKYLVHRIIWLLVYGTWPEHQIDHIDGNKRNNRPENLRDVTGLENTRAHFRRNSCQPSININHQTM